MMRVGSDESGKSQGAGYFQVIYMILTDLVSEERCLPCQFVLM